MNDKLREALVIANALQNAITEELAASKPEPMKPPAGVDDQAVYQAIANNYRKPEPQAQGTPYERYKAGCAAAMGLTDPQAQAVEPEVISRLVYWRGPADYPVPHGGVAARSFAEYSREAADDPKSYWKNGPELITLQSHREAMAKTQAACLESVAAVRIAFDEHIAKKDAALKACALPESYTSGTCLSYPGRRAEVTLHFSSIEDADRWFSAITQTNEVLERKEGRV